MFDHVTVGAADIEEARRFYGSALALLGFGEAARVGNVFQWQDLSIAQARDERVTRHAHLGLVASSREHVDVFWRTLTEQGFRDDGPPGLREKYRRGYYGAFVLDPDENSIEAVHKESMRTDGGCIDHVWLRVRDVAASTQFYEMLGPLLGYRLTAQGPTHASFRSQTAGLTVTSSDESWSVRRSLTENIDLAFSAPDSATVDEFLRVALAAGYRQSGPLRERREGAGDYSAYVLDPDGNDVGAVVQRSLD